MPALPPVPQVLRFQFVMGLAGINVFTHWFFQYTGGAPSNTDAAALATSASTNWQAQYAPLAASTVSLVAANVTDLTSPTAAFGTNATTRVGTRAGSELTANDCVLVNMKVARRYRGGKPRQYWPFGVQGDLLSPFFWSTTFQSLVATNLATFNSNLLALTWTGGNISRPVNVSYFQGFTVVTNPITGRARNVPKLRTTPVVDPVTAYAVSQRVATQRRRQHFSA